MRVCMYTRTCLYVINEPGYGRGFILCCVYAFAFMSGDLFYTSSSYIYIFVGGKGEGLHMGWS
jgi:hypothetical protein